MCHTGAADASVIVWGDTTEADAAAAAEEEEQLAEREQELANALADQDFATAARLAFDLKHPGRFLAVVTRAAAGSLTPALGASMAALLGRAGKGVGSGGAERPKPSVQQLLNGLVRL